MQRLGKVEYHQAEVLRVFAEETEQDRLHGAAVGALEVEELDDRDRRVGRTVDRIVVSRDGQQRWLWFREQDLGAGGGQLSADPRLLSIAAFAGAPPDQLGDRHAFRRCE